MQNSGRPIVIGVFALAVTMSAGAWWYHFQATRQTVAFWGAESANLLIRGELVDAYNLAPGDAAAGQGSDGEPFPNWPPPFATLLESGAVDYHDLTGAKGLIHLRHALTQDSSFEWDQTPVNAAPPWGIALRFGDDDGAAWVLLSEQLDYLGKPAADGQSLDIQPLRPKVGPVLREYFQDIGVLAQPKKDSASPATTGA